VHQRTMNTFFFFQTVQREPDVQMGHLHILTATQRHPLCTVSTIHEQSVDKIQPIPPSASMNGGAHRKFRVPPSCMLGGDNHALGIPSSSDAPCGGHEVPRPPMGANPEQGLRPRFGACIVSPGSPDSPQRLEMTQSTKNSTGHVHSTCALYSRSTLNLDEVIIACQEENGEWAQVERSHEISQQ